MFNTIKSKITIITVLMLLALCILLSAFSFLYLKTSKNLIIIGCSHSIATLAQNINKEIIRIEDNAKDLALQGEMFYYIDKNRTTAEQVIIDLFENYENSLGGGIWFKPYLLRKDKKYFCIYAYRNKQNKVVIDNQFETEDYNYPEKSWYVEIMPKLNEKNNVVWSSPYYEKEGSNTLMMTAGSGIYSNGTIVGLSTVDWEISSIVKSVSEMKPTPNSFALFADIDHDYIIASTDPNLNNDELIGKSVKSIPWYKSNLKQVTYITYKGHKYIPYVKTLDNGMIYIVVIPKNELFAILYRHVIALFAVLMGISLMISALLYLGLKRNIDKPIDKLTDIANKISHGDLNTEIRLEKPEEFARLASTFNRMAGDIKNITKERERIESELSLAKTIQASSLPNVFPPFPDKKEFDIFASMTPAKEVGGDFYDFYFIDENKFMFLIADVSGKGVPAALFMMTVKTLINYIAQSGLEPSQMAEEINRKICSNNKQGFFVTVLFGIVDISNGKISFVNCGHNPPIIKQNGKYEYKNLNSNIVLGAFDNAKFEVDEMQLNVGDEIIIYTDGITEAVNDKDELYGEERLLNSVINSKEATLEEKVSEYREDVKIFTQNYPQSDDMTMLVFKYTGSDDTKIYANDAKKENYKDFLNWLYGVFDSNDIAQDKRFKLELVSEEIYTNIASYAYTDNIGKICIETTKENNKFIMRFIDWGTPYNPLERPDPDVNFPPESREQGGLGIFIVKNSVDEISYEYKDGKNILSVSLYL